MKKRGIWKIVVAAVFFINGLRAFTITNVALELVCLSAILNWIIACVFILWWGVKKAKEKTNKDSTDFTDINGSPAIKEEQKSIPPKPPVEKKYESAASRIAREAAMRYEHVKVRLVGVTFKNKDGKSRQSVLRHMRFQDPPFDEYFDIEMRRYDFEGEPAIAVDANGTCIGNIPKDRVLFFIERWDRIMGITNIEVIGGGTNEYGENLNYGAEVIIKLKKEEKS